MIDMRTTFENIGDKLKRAREEANLSQQQIAERLRLTLNQVEAIEAGCEDIFGASIYSRGYVANYARQVGINPQKLMREWDHPAATPLQAATVRQPDHRVAEGIARWSSYLVGTAVVLLPIWWWASEGTLDALLGQTGMESQPAGTEMMAPVEVQPQGPADPSTSSEQPVLAAMAPIPSLARDLETGPPEPPLSDTEAARAASRRAPYTGSDPVSSPLPTAPKSPRLELTLSGDSWVEIRDANGVRLEYDLLQGGTTHRYRGTPPLQVLLGNADQVSVRYNDSPFDFSAKVKGNLARFEVGISSEQG